VQNVRATLVAAATVVALGVSSLAVSAGEANSKLALTVSVEGAIGPATARYVKDALTKASERHAEIVVLRLNTPGGLSTSMREIIADVLASRVPVVGTLPPPEPMRPAPGPISSTPRISRPWPRAPISERRRRCRLAARCRVCRRYP
jgi:membrane-bound serine protease (ClpP class)